MSLNVRVCSAVCAALGVLGMMPDSAEADPAFASGVSLGTVDFGPLRQASGIAVSRNNPGVLWTHNDAGDSPRIFALDTQGRALGTYNLTGAGKVDYEDIAIGPGPVPGVDYLFVADIGDNNANRSDIAVIQIPEPAVNLRQSANPQTFSTKGVRSITLTYPDGPHNAEAALVDPLTGDFYLATKQPGVSRIFTATKAQLDAGGPVVLTFVREIAFDVVSGGAISPTGSEIILRQEDFALLWRRAPGQTVAEALDSTPTSIPVIGRPSEPNGEAIGFDAIGSGYYTLSDSATTQPLYYFARTSPYLFTPPHRLVDGGTTWRYLDTGVDQSNAWLQPGFNDATWKTGDGPFGYGDGDEHTLVSFGGNGSNKFLTTYFRKTFNVVGAAALGSLVVRMQFDDGATVYLNGTPIVRANLPAGAVFNTPASALQEDLEDTWFAYAVDPTLLAEGTNTLAVEVHQQSASSPDLSFDLQLLAYNRIPLQTPLLSRLANSAARLHITGTPGASVTVEASSNLLDWSSVDSVALGVGSAIFDDPIAAGKPQRFYRLRGH